MAFDVATVDFIPDRPEGFTYDVRLTRGGTYAGYGKAFGDYDAALEYAQEQARKTKVTNAAYEAGKRTWPPNDTSLMTSADWVH